MTLFRRSCSVLQTCKNTHKFFYPQNSRFHCFWMTFSQKTTIETQKWWPFQIILTFLFIHLLSFRRSCYMYETCKNTHKLTCNTFAAPKSGSNCLHGETYSNYWSWDKGMVWYGMAWWFTRKMAKPVKGHHFQRYTHITRLFPYYLTIIFIYFPTMSLVVPYYFLMCSLFVSFFSIIYLLFPSYFPIFALLFPYNFLLLPYYWIILDT